MLGCDAIGNHSI